MTGLTAAIGAAGLLAGALLTWLTTRRATSGKVETSSADVLWEQWRIQAEQAQVMRAELVAQRDKAAEQRDRLVDAQAAQIVPALAAITVSLGEITGSLDRLERRDERGQEAPAG